MNIIGIDIGNHSTKLYSLSGADMNIIEGTVGRYIPTAISFDNILKCRYFADESMIKLISCSTTLTNLSSKLFDYKRTVIFDKNKYVLTGQYIYIMYINYIYNHLVEKSRIDTCVIPYPDYYSHSEVNVLTNSYKNSEFNQSPVSIYYIPHSIAIGLEYGLYKSYKQGFNTNTNILFIDIGHINISFYLIRYNKLSMTVERTWVLQNRGADYLDKMLLNSVVDELPIRDNITEKVLKKILVNMESIRKNLNMYDKTILHIDALYDDVDLNIEIKKNEYLSLYDDVLGDFKKIIHVFTNNYDISNIELLGGFSYYNIFNDIISEVVDIKIPKIPINHSLKAEETIARGACLYGSVVLPVYKNIKYTINYKYPYCICVIIDNDKRILFENETLPFNKDIIKRYDRNKPRLVNKNIYIKIYILEGDTLPAPIYNIKHNASSLIDKLSINLIIGLDLSVIIKSISYITTTRKKYNISWDKQSVQMDTYKRYNDILIKYDMEYKNKLKLINTFEEYIYNLDSVKKNELTKINPGLFDELEKWLMYDALKLTYRECIDKIEYFTQISRC